MRIYKNDGYILEIGGEKEDEFKTREKAAAEGKVMMLKSWLPGAEEDDIRNMLASHLEIDFNFLREWCEKQAEEKPDCDCGCWGYPLEMGTLWTWDMNKYRGCPKCGHKV